MTLPNDNIIEVLAAQAHIWHHTFNYINSMSLKCALQLGTPDIIHSHGQAMTLSDLVDVLPIENNAKILDYIFRLMHILIHAGFFNQTKVNNKEDEEEEGYILTPTSRLLLKDDLLSQVPYVQTELDPYFMDPWHSLSKWIMKGDESSTTPFAFAHGKPLFDCDTPLVASIVIQHCKGVFEGLKSLLDVGGGTRAVAKVIANALPEINCIVFDLPHIIEGCEASKNLSYVTGDMFQSIPSADAMLLKSVLHDWSDEDCIKILRKCKEAIPSKENGGKERNQQEWEKLFFDVGFTDYNIIPTLGLRSIIEAFP
ncbi:hypothetical protein HAX54_005607 [Datura stramonium]|uniref:Trans-resveratrol di-O-methyltransferase n=1 Tax=Datura stramonium TaxID=4076 RepID=A0ABS8TAE4_DATST|nr:hypothetical protein [Datura stramonium]